MRPRQPAAVHSFRWGAAHPSRLCANCAQLRSLAQQSVRSFCFRDHTLLAWTSCPFCCFLLLFFFAVFPSFPFSSSPLTDASRQRMLRLLSLRSLSIFYSGQCIRVYLRESAAVRLSAKAANQLTSAASEFRLATRRPKKAHLYSVPAHYVAALVGLVFYTPLPPPPFQASVLSTVSTSYDGWPADGTRRLYG